MIKLNSIQAFKTLIHKTLFYSQQSNRLPSQALSCQFIASQGFIFYLFITYQVYGFERNKVFASVYPLLIRPKPLPKEIKLMQILKGWLTSSFHVSLIALVANDEDFSLCTDEPVDFNSTYYRRLC